MNERKDLRFPMARGSARVEPLQAGSPVPSGRARVLDWSRGGALIELELDVAPERFVGHWLELSLRLPPSGGLLEVHARVNHARRQGGLLRLGLCFDASTMDLAPVMSLDAMLRQAWAPHLRRRRPAVVATPAESLARQSDDLAKRSRRLLRRSAELKREASQRRRWADVREANLLLSESRQLHERGRELERESRLLAARSQQQADSERLRALTSA